jgi:hypothetical protein
MVAGSPKGEKSPESPEFKIMFSAYHYNDDFKTNWRKI